MFKSWLSTFLSLGLLGIGATAERVPLGIDDARILYDKSWTASASNSKLKNSVNGSIYFFYGGTDLTVHYAPPKDGNMHLWLDGTQYLDLKLAATTAPQSPVDSSLKATNFVLPLGGHQIHISGSSVSASDPVVFGGLNVNLDERTENSSNFGVPTGLNVEIIDNTAFNYSAGWEVAAEAPFSYNSTLMRTRTKGAWVSFTFQKPWLQFMTYGTKSERSVVQTVYSHQNGQVQSGVSALLYPVNDTLIQAVISSNLDRGTAGSLVNFTLDEGTMAIDFVAVVYDEPSKPTRNTVKIVVPVLIVGLLFLTAVACFVLRSRKRKSAGQEKNKHTLYFFQGLERPQGGKL